MLNPEALSHGEPNTQPHTRARAHAGTHTNAKSPKNPGRARQRSTASGDERLVSSGVPQDKQHIRTHTTRLFVEAGLGARAPARTRTLPRSLPG